MKKPNKKETILLAAAKLFRDRGYQATSMRDLAEAVDLKASSLYNHIGSKEEILSEICLQNADRFSSGMEGITKMQEGPLLKIKALIKLHIEIAITDYTSITSFNDEWRHLSEPALSEFTGKRKLYEQQFKEIIKAGIEQDLIKAVDPQICLNTILSSTRWVYDYKAKADIEKNTNSIIGILLDGISM